MLSSIIVSILVLGIFAPVIANASDWSSEQGVTKTYTMAGTLGSLTIIDKPYISSTAFADHRDYMVYMNLNNFQTIGAGAFAYRDTSGNVNIYTREYWYNTSGRFHNAVQSIPVGSNFTVKVVQNTGSTSNCWTASTYAGQNQQVCFSNTTYPPNNAGNTARTITPYSYVANTDDMPGLFDFLQVGKWSGGNVVFGDYFSGSTTNNYKCWAGHGYVMTTIAGYGGGGPYDKIGTGPRDYFTNNCQVQNSGYEAWGE